MIKIDDKTIVRTAIKSNPNPNPNASSSVMLLSLKSAAVTIITKMHILR